MSGKLITIVAVLALAQGCVLTYDDGYGYGHDVDVTYEEEIGAHYITCDDVCSELVQGCDYGQYENCEADCLWEFIDYPSARCGAAIQDLRACDLSATCSLESDVIRCADEVADFQYYCWGGIPLY